MHHFESGPYIAPRACSRWHSMAAGSCKFPISTELFFPACIVPAQTRLGTPKIGFALTARAGSTNPHRTPSLEGPCQAKISSGPHFGRPRGDVAVAPSSFVSIFPHYPFPPPNSPHTRQHDDEADADALRQRCLRLTPKRNKTGTTQQQPIVIVCRSRAAGITASGLGAEVPHLREAPSAAASPDAPEVASFVAFDAEVENSSLVLTSSIMLALCGFSLQGAWRSGSGCPVRPCSAHQASRVRYVAL